VILDLFISQLVLPVRHQYWGGKVARLFSINGIKTENQKYTFCHTYRTICWITSHQSIPSATWHL